MTADLRERIVEAAARLLREGGRDAVSTRAVSAAAGVQVPAIYRAFTDMRGLLDATASHGFAAYLADKLAQEETDDPVEDLRRGWDLHLAFARAEPAFYRLIFGEDTTAAGQALDLLRGKVRRVALAGRLRVGEELAAQLIHATGRGIALSAPADDALATAARESVLATVTGEAPARAGGAAQAAIALRASVDDTPLTTAERALMTEWLDRIITG